jgi:ferredoxin
VTAERVAVDPGRCQGYGMCVAFHPGVFDLTPGTAVATVVHELIDEDDRADVQEAVLACPARAITLTRATS